METHRTDASDWTLKRLLEWTADYFARAPLDQPRLAAEILLAHVLECPRIQLYTDFDRAPDPDQTAAFRQLVQRAAKHEPVAYLTGRAHFFSLEFDVAPAVLIPRPETETLVAEAIAFCRHDTNRPRVRVLDLCTGSACIAVAIAANVPEADLLATDFSPAALEIAQRNVEKHDLAPRIELLQSNLFETVASAENPLFDLIVSNPPYIADDLWQTLDPNVRDYEPAAALRAGPDGLDFYRRILNDAQPFLADAGALMLEVAFDQADAVCELCQQTDYLTRIETVRDTLGHKRVVKARNA